jgi:hypothetical protein
MFDLKLTTATELCKLIDKQNLIIIELVHLLQWQQVPYISNRFAMERFLGLSKEEIAENERTVA